MEDLTLPMDLSVTPMEPSYPKTPLLFRLQKVFTYAPPTYPFYSGYPYVAPYGAYPYTATHTGVTPVYTTPYHHLIKREAEAEAEADPALVYHHGGPHLTAHHNYQYGYPAAYPYGYPTTMGYPYKYSTTYGAYPYKYPTTFGAYPYTTPYTGVAPVYTAPMTHTITPASTTKLVPNVMPLAPKLF